MLSIIGVLYLLLLIFYSAEAAPPHPSLATVTHNLHHPFPRYLQECNATSTSREFYFQALGPSNDTDSLYRNVVFENITQVPNDDGVVGNLRVNVSDLASSLLLVDLWSNYFMQENQSFGHDGEYTREIMSQHTLLTKFWKVEGLPVVVAGLHSELLGQNIDTAVRDWAWLNGNLDTYNITDEEIDAVAELAREAITTELPDNYASPALTYQAYFIANFGPRGFDNSSIIVIGDGVLDFITSLGLDEVGSDLVHAHEFGHALQFKMDLENAGGDFEAYLKTKRANRTAATSRKIELEADAMAAYALAHEQGRNFDVSLLVQATKVAYAHGSCNVGDNKHHGMPRQRECAVRWGSDEGLDMTGDPVSPREFRQLFFLNYELILALDPGACSLTDDTGESTPSNPSESPISSTDSPAVESVEPSRSPVAEFAAPTNNPLVAEPAEPTSVPTPSRSGTEPTLSPVAESTLTPVAESALSPGPLTIASSAPISTPSPVNSLVGPSQIEDGDASIDGSTISAASTTTLIFAIVLSLGAWALG